MGASAGPDTLGLGCLPQLVRLDGAGVVEPMASGVLGGGWCLMAVPTNGPRLELRGWSRRKPFLGSCSWRDKG